MEICINFGTTKPSALLRDYTELKIEECVSRYSLHPILVELTLKNSDQYHKTTSTLLLHDWDGSVYHAEGTESDMLRSINMMFEKLNEQFFHRLEHYA